MNLVQFKSRIEKVSKGLGKKIDKDGNYECVCDCLGKHFSTFSIGVDFESCFYHFFSNKENHDCLFWLGPRIKSNIKTRREYLKTFETIAIKSGLYKEYLLGGL